MQKARRFKATDGKVIEVEVNSRQGNKNAILIVHGLCGYINEAMLYNAALTFPAKGFDVWRIWLYGDGKNMRSMLNIKFSQMIGDIQTIVNKMAREYKSLSLIGHSMGGAQIIYVDHPKIACKVLWDPACVKNKKIFDAYEKEYTGKTLHPKYATINWGIVVMAPKTFLTESHDYYWFARNAKKLPRKQPPLLVVRASVFEKFGWVQDILPAKLVVIPNSDHAFAKSEDNQKQLFAQTLKFIKAHTPAKQR